jgi:hypothetical protein
MKKKSLVTGILTAFAHVCLCQVNHLSSDSINREIKYLYIIDFPDKPPIATENAFIATSKIVNMKLLPDSQSKAVCELLKIDKILVLSVRYDTRLLTLDQIFNLYKIQTKYRKLSVRVDDETIENPETLLISEGQIDGVKIIKSLKGDYMSVILKYYYRDKKELEDARKKGLIFVN